MKKTTIAILMSLLCTTTFAKVKITFGSADFMKTDATAIVDIDYSETTWEEDQTFKNWCGEDYDERVKISIESFIEGFNKKSKSIKIKQEDSSARYRITFKIANMEQKYTGWGYGRFAILCYGTLTVQDIVTEETVCTIAIEKEGGDADFVPNDRISSCFKELGMKVANL